MTSNICNLGFPAGAGNREKSKAVSESDQGSASTISGYALLGSDLASQNHCSSFVK